LEKQADIQKEPPHRLRHWWRYFIASAIIPLLITAALLFIYFTQEQKADPTSARIIREVVAQRLHTNPNELTNEDFASITTFRLKNIKLCDVKLLEKFTNLQELEMSSLRYPESAIPKWMILLSKLGIYDFSKRFVIDLSPLEKLAKLEKIDIISTSVKDIKPLSNLINLKRLMLNRVQITDLEPVMGLKNLRELIVIDASISNIEPLKGLTNLQVIEIGFSEISNLEPLRELKNLQSLYLYQSAVYDLEPIKGLHNLQRLDLAHCKKITKEQIIDFQKLFPNIEISYGD